MSEFGGPESYSPDEGPSSGVPEQLSEEAKQRFAAAAAAIQQIKHEEKKSKKKDDQVAQVIIQFLSDQRFSHLFVLISRLVARNCPSIFILSLLSIIHDTSKKVVQEYLEESLGTTVEEVLKESMALLEKENQKLTENTDMVDWITRIQMVLSLDAERILTSLMLDEKNIDGTVLQLTTFVLQEFFLEQKKEAPFEKIQPLTASILQTIFEPFIADAKKALLKKAEEKEGKKDEET